MKRYSVEEKKEGHRTFEEILDRLDSMGRGPDHWEENSLVHAINFMECGLYDRAGTALMSASCRPTNGRHGDWPRSNAIRSAIPWRVCA